jgi:hypothetical protein
MTTPPAARTRRPAWTAALGVAVIIAVAFSATASAALDRRPSPIQGAKGSDLMPKGGNAGRYLGSILMKFRPAPRQVSELKAGGKAMGPRKPPGR